MVVINKAEEERCVKDISERCPIKLVYRLKHCDNKFYYENITRYLRDVWQDKYSTIHDIIADVFYKQVNCGHAYTSSSSLAGHHNMDLDGTLIFNLGEPLYVTDTPIEELFGELIEPWNTEGGE